MARTSRTTGKTPKRRKAARDTAVLDGGSAAPPVVSLDEAAMRLMQVEPGDMESIARAREALEQISMHASLSAAARETLAAAALAMRDATHDAETLNRIIADASRAIEAAMRGTLEDAVRATSVQASERRSPSNRASLPHAVRQPQRDEPLPADADRTLLRDFVTEAREFADEAQAALLALESDPDDADAVNTVFRAFHTIKGTAAFLGLDRIKVLAHHAESLLERIRKGAAQCAGVHADLALRSVDLLRALLDAVDAGLDGAPVRLPDGYDVLLEQLAAPETATAGRALSDGVAGPRRDDAREMPSAAAREMPSSGSRPRTPERDAKNTVRVRTDRLDRLIDLVGELVIAQSMLAQDEAMRAGGHHGLSRIIAHAGKLTRELHDLSMSLRMVPLKGTFLKLARQVRDLGQKTGKQVELVVDGAETEIDRHMVDAIADPLMHMVRNAVDHGIESPAEREALGKPRTGVIRVSASHAGGSVVVELSDDGRGLDRERITRKAMDAGLIAPDHALTEREAFELIFAPGFSTAQAVTDVSGRGVGLDVVRRNIEALRGRVDIESAPGQGTRFLLRLPLTLAVTDGMLIRVGAERYIVPTAHIQMSFRPERGMLSTVVGRGELVMLRGELLPVVRLHRLFGVEGAVTDPTAALLMIVGDSQRRTALLVDELLGQQQVVAKPLGSGIDAVPGISGGAILGDGRVGLILDVGAVVTIARHTPTTEHATHVSRSVA
ncbi:MAG TPA: chemotaxis protein CheA [Gemmatimonadaceae bacterium]